MTYVLHSLRKFVRKGQCIHCFTDKHGFCFAETFREFFRHGSEIFMPSKEVRRARRKERTKTRKEYVAC
jgi:hypothetical protein